MKNGILIISLILLTTVGLAQEQEQAAELHGTFDVTYVSQYMWRGYDAYANDHSAIQPSIDIDLYGTGFGFNVWMSRANGSGFENSEWINYTLYYNNQLFEGERYATNYRIGWTYFSYPDSPRKGSNPGTGAAQEIFLALAWPNICPGGVVPSYAAICYWPSEGKALNRNNGGWAHVFGLDYNLTVPGFLPGTAEQVLHLSAQTVYNDSVGPVGKAADHDWSHAVFGVSTAFPITEDLTFTPGIYYQSSWDDSINTQDEFWTSLSLAYTF